MRPTPRQSEPVRAIAWRDLTTLRPAEQVRELLLPLPFLLAARGAELSKPTVF